MNIQDKIDRAIELIRKGENLALSYNEEGYLLGFSGGKDSQAVYHLAKEAGVKFHAVMNRTTIEPYAVIEFIRQNYPDVEIRHPKDKEGRPTNFYRELERKGLPARHMRWCCSKFKELEGRNRVMLLGIRAAESNRRTKQNPTALKAFGAKSRLKAGDHGTINEESRGVTKHVDLYDIDREQLIDCMKGADKVMLSPIYDWSEEDVWAYLNDIARVPHCKLYDQGNTRTGCLFCPMASERQHLIERELYPNVYKAIREHAKKSRMAANSKLGNIDDLMDWWISGLSVNEYLSRKSQLCLSFEDAK